MRFMMVGDDLRVAQIKVIKQADIGKCPHVILAPEHYRDDGTCRCDDITHIEMVEWGYGWDEDTNQWIAPPEGFEC